MTAPTKSLTPSYLGCALILAISIGASPALADRNDRFEWTDFHFDGDKRLKNKLSKNQSYGGELAFKFDFSDNLKRADTLHERESEIELEQQLNLRYDNGRSVRSYLELRLSEQSKLVDQSQRRDQDVSIFSENRNQALTFGRWSVSDKREWLFDEGLDGVHYCWRNQSYAVELMYGSEQIFEKDFLDRHDDDEPYHFYARKEPSTLRSRAAPSSPDSLHLSAQHCEHAAGKGVPVPGAARANRILNCVCLTQ